MRMSAPTIRPGASGKACLRPPRRNLLRKRKKLSTPLSKLLQLQTSFQEMPRGKSLRGKLPARLLQAFVHQHHGDPAAEKLKIDWKRIRFLYCPPAHCSIWQPIESGPFSKRELNQDLCLLLWLNWPIEPYADREQPRCMGTDHIDGGQSGKVWTCMYCSKRVDNEM